MPAILRQATWSIGEASPVSPTYTLVTSLPHEMWVIESDNGYRHAGIPVSVQATINSINRELRGSMAKPRKKRDRPAAWLRVGASLFNV